LPATKIIRNPTQFPLAFLDTFTSDTNDWPNASSCDEDHKEWFILWKYQINNGKYRIEHSAIKGVFQWYKPYGLQSQSDFYLVVYAALVNGVQTSVYGLKFKEENNGNDYIFEGSNDGYYRVTLQKSSQLVTLVSLTKSDAIRCSNQVNRLAVVAQGNHFTFFINSQFVAYLEDDTIQSGKVEPAVELSAGENATVEFDNFELRTP
jgi:hypothetical protein